MTTRDHDLANNLKLPGNGKQNVDAIMKTINQSINNFRETENVISDDEEEINNNETQDIYIEVIQVNSLHPSERLKRKLQQEKNENLSKKFKKEIKRKKKIGKFDDIQTTGIRLEHLRDRLRRRRRDRIIKQEENEDRETIVYSDIVDEIN